MAETLKKWEEIGRSYRVYIKLEKRLSENTVESYMRDLRQFAHFILRFYDVPPRKVEAPMIERYLALLYDQGREKTSQARALSGLSSAKIMIGKRQAKLNFLFSSSLQTEFTSVLCVCFGRRSFELVRATSYL